MARQRAGSSPRARRDRLRRHSARDHPQRAPSRGRYCGSPSDVRTFCGRPDRSRRDVWTHICDNPAGRRPSSSGFRAPVPTGHRRGERGVHPTTPRPRRASRRSLTPGNSHPGNDVVLRIPATALRAAGASRGDLLVATEGGALTDAIKMHRNRLPSPARCRRARDRACRGSHSVCENRLTPRPEHRTHLGSIRHKQLGRLQGDREHAGHQAVKRDRLGKRARATDTRARRARQVAGVTDSITLWTSIWAPARTDHAKSARGPDGERSEVGLLSISSPPIMARSRE